MEKTNKIKYWIYTAFYLVLSYFLVNFSTILLNNWNNPKIESSFSWIKGRLGEVIGFGISIVIIIYVLSSIVLLIINVNKFGLKNINYKALVRIHNVVLTAFIIYSILYLIFFLKI